MLSLKPLGAEKDIKWQLLTQVMYIPRGLQKRYSQGAPILEYKARKPYCRSFTAFKMTKKYIHDVLYTLRYM